MYISNMSLYIASVSGSLRWSERTELWTDAWLKKQLILILYPELQHMYKQRLCMPVDLIHKQICVSVHKCKKKTNVSLKVQVLQEETTGGPFECKQRATWQGDTFFPLLTRCLVREFLHYVRRLAGWAHALAGPSLTVQSESSLGHQWGPVFCSSTCNKILCVQQLSLRWTESEGQDIKSTGGLGGGASGQWAKTAITLCATAVIPHGHLLPW